MDPMLYGYMIRVADILLSTGAESLEGLTLRAENHESQGWS